MVSLSVDFSFGNVGMSSSFLNLKDVFGVLKRSTISFTLCPEPRQTQIDAQQQKDKQKEQDKEEGPPEHRQVEEQPLEPEGC